MAPTSRCFSTAQLPDGRLAARTTSLAGARVGSWISQTLNAALREELIAMRAEDLRVRQELAQYGELGGSYVPRMEAVHIRNAQRLEEIIDESGWPDERVVGEDGAKAAWFIAQHAIGLPNFQRKCLALLQHSAKEGRVPRWHGGISGRSSSHARGTSSASRNAMA